AAHLARLRRLVPLHDLDEQSFRHDVQSLVGIALTGDHADFAATVAVEEGTAEHALDKGPLGWLEPLRRRDDRVRPMPAQALLLQVLREQQHRASVGLKDARAMVRELLVEGGEARLGHVGGVEPERLAPEGAAEARAPVATRGVAGGAPENRHAVANVPAGPAVLAQRRRRPRPPPLMT